MGYTCVGSALFLGNFRVQLGKSLDVGLVDDRLVVRNLQEFVAVPVEEGVDDHAQHHVRCGVSVIPGVRVPHVVGEQGRVPIDLTMDGLGVRVQQQLVGVEPLAGVGVVGSVHPIAIFLSGLDLRQVAVPHVAVYLGDIYADFPAVVVEEAQLHFLGLLAEQREVGAGPVKGGSKRIGRSRPDFHAFSSG
ncbi:hypothetical protein StoSoilB13_16390 [Arthrobacter sp. StoSoilB13]|nr:hypothetical protein StoSoilB13_16390 [Arthrobacter sp. StoSoilB13]